MRRRSCKIGTKSADFFHCSNVFSIQRANMLSPSKVDIILERVRDPERQTSVTYSRDFDN